MEELIMDKFKVGDKVKIVKSSKNRYIGDIATITKSDNFGCYEIDLDERGRYWFNEAFERYEEQPKEYNIHNLLNNFDEETVFQYMDLRYKIYCGALYHWDTEEQRPMWRKSAYSLKRILNMKFTKIEDPKLKPMTFEEAVKTGKKIKYKYDGYTLDKFHNTQNIFKHLVSPMYGSKTVSEIILEGTWFAEGVYE
jgi:hypothetical protein